MQTLEDKIDKKATRKAVQQHLRVLGKRMFKSDILDYMSFSSSIIGGTGGGNSTTDMGSKTLRAIYKTEKENKEVHEYIETLIMGINRLEPSQRKLIFGKYLYKYDQEEFEEELNMTMRTIYRQIREAEIDLAIILGCAVYNL